MPPENPYRTRLEALRSMLTLNWGELADHLGISRAMLDFIRTGARSPSPKTLRLIEAAERAVGIAAKPKLAVRQDNYTPPGMDAQDEIYEPESLKDLHEKVRLLQAQLDSITKILGAAAIKPTKSKGGRDASA